MALKTIEIAWISPYVQILQDYINIMNSSEFQEYPSSYILNIVQKSSIIYAYPISAVLIYYGYKLYNKGLTKKYSSSYNMKSLAKKESVNWPQISPVLDIDLVKTDLLKGPWSMALNPLEFSEKHNLVDIAVNNASGLGEKTYTITVKKDLAGIVFVKQLGPIWSGIDILPMHYKALFAIFAARINRERDIPLKLIYQMSSSSRIGKIDFTGVNDLLDKYKNSELVHKITNRHSYVLTVMSAMLSAARLDGVVASADFLWIKPIDRILWYTINCIGRQTPYVEVAGPFAHWLAECRLGAKIKVPMVGTAVDALDIAVQEIKYKPK